MIAALVVATLLFIAGTATCGIASTCEKNSDPCKRRLALLAVGLPMIVLAGLVVFIAYGWVVFLESRQINEAIGVAMSDGRYVPNEEILNPSKWWLRTR